MTDLEKVIEFIEIHGNGTNDGELTVDMVYKYAQALQLRQSPVSGSFNKCTCLHPHPSCLTGHCTICNRPILKNITTDDLKNCH